MLEAKRLDDRCRNPHRMVALAGLASRMALSSGALGQPHKLRWRPTDVEHGGPYVRFQQYRHRSVPDECLDPTNPATENWEGRIDQQHWRREEYVGLGGDACGGAGVEFTRGCAAQRVAVPAADIATTALGGVKHGLDLVANVIPMWHEAPAPMFGTWSRPEGQQNDRVIAVCPAEERTSGLQKA